MTRRGSIRLAVALWLVLACLVWNVVFDRLVVLAGRRYSYEATLLFRTTGHYLKIDDVMRPAVAHAAWVASMSAGAIVIGALVLIRLAVSRDPAKRSG